ncbi:hypothetical protein BDZ45DRAFT_439246 [Acephala macrosclerotiorum]|nr:hypothetical protein BDZ45DRAFT_439246 [Acephala macrosclerotiorum]
MNSGQYHRQPQLHGLPINFSYPDGPGPSSQSNSSHRMLSCDGPPRSQSQQFMTSSTSSSLLPVNYDLVNPMPISMSHSAPLWTDPSQQQSFEDPNTSGYYGFSPAITGNDGNGVWLRDMDPGVPRWMPENIRLFQDPSNMSMDSYDPSMYMIDPNKSDDMPNNHHRSNMSYPSLEEPRDFARLSISHSPGPKMEDDGFGPSSLPYDKPPPFMASNESSEDGGGNSSREMTAVDLDDHGADEPYAKLIYRALMSAPNHSMVLQEIYQWFRENTQKGSSDGKGWMNSIRHNLSMNAAFKKTERKLPGDDSKKSTEWVLEPFAIKDGVQSTTRYRKGTSSKKQYPRLGGDGSHHPAPSRQLSGRKGGICASKTKLQRQQRQREDRERLNQTFDSRFSPSPFDPRGGSGVGNRSLSMIDNARRAQFERATRTQIENQRRQRSPLTPPLGEMSPTGANSGPYFFLKAEQQEEHVPFEDVYALEDCQGVYLDDNGPLFSNGHGGHVGLGGEGGGSFHVGSAAGPAVSSSRL